MARFHVLFRSIGSKILQTGTKHNISQISCLLLVKIRKQNISFNLQPIIHFLTFVPCWGDKSDDGPQLKGTKEMVIMV